MGVLTEFFIATPTDLQHLHSDVRPSDIFTATDFKGVSFEELTDLRMLITQIPKMTDDDVEQESTLLFNQNDQSLVYQLPVAFRDVLAATDDLRINDLAKAWLQTVHEDLVLWDPTDVERGLRDVIELSRQAQQTDHMLYLWHYV
jgi:hypothetical protein